MNKNILTMIIVSLIAPTGYSAQGTSTTSSTTQDTLQNKGSTQGGTVGTTEQQVPDRQMRTTEDASTRSRTTTSTTKGIKEPMSAKDTAITRSIREQITADNSLSMRAKNVTIATQNGRITLKGAVANNSEKAKLEEIAKKVSGVQSVDNQTEVQSY